MASWVSTSVRPGPLSFDKSMARPSSLWRDSSEAVTLEPVSRAKLQVRIQGGEWQGRRRLARRAGTHEVVHDKAVIIELCEKVAFAIEQESALIGVGVQQHHILRPI